MCRAYHGHLMSLRALNCNPVAVPPNGLCDVSKVCVAWVVEVDGTSVLPKVLCSLLGGFGVASKVLWCQVAPVSYNRCVCEVACGGILHASCAI